MTQLVIDRNLIRRNGLSDLADRSGTEFILTDTFLVEMVKHPEKWDDTVRRDFSALTPFSNQVRISLSVSEALRTEIREQRAITRDELLPPEFLSIPDELMHAVKAGGISFALLQRRIAAVLPALKAEQPDPHVPKARTEDLVNMLGHLLDDHIISDLRNRKLQGDAKLGLIEDAAFRAYKAHCDEQSKKMLPTHSSMTSRFYILKVWRAIWWLQNSGLDTAKAGKLHNDSYDDEYILIGSFLDGVLSNEDRVKEAHIALMRILECISSGQLRSALQQYLENLPNQRIYRS